MLHQSTHCRSIMTAAAAAMLLLSCTASAWTTTTAPASIVRVRPFTSKTLLKYGNDGDKYAENLPLSSFDREILSDYKSRHETLPIMVLETTLLPGQRLEYSSADPKFKRLIDHVFNCGGGEIGTIGLNPYTNRPLNMGVTFDLKKHQVATKENGEHVITIQGHRRFEILGDVWEDDTESFHFADVEMLENKFEPIHEWQYNQTLDLSYKMVDLVDEWIVCVLRSGTASSSHIKELLQDLGPMPREFAQRAIWVAALINPTTSPMKAAAADIRPSMLACKNDHDRMQLAYAAITTSIDHLSVSFRSDL